MSTGLQVHGHRLSADEYRVAKLAAIVAGGILSHPPTTVVEHRTGISIERAETHGPDDLALRSVLIAFAILEQVERHRERFEAANPTGAA